MSRRSLPLAKVDGLLEPGSVALLTAARGGRANVMTLSRLTMMEFEPPLVGGVASDRNHSFRALKATRECVINIPTVEIGGTGARHIPGTVSAIPLWRVPSDAR
jgi:flavin reductase (DIM6/NTAB) family NADH-FMN oxidoreductase RutF